MWPVTCGWATASDSFILGYTWLPKMEQELKSHILPAPELTPVDQTELAQREKKGMHKVTLHGVTPVICLACYWLLLCAAVVN